MNRQHNNRHGDRVLRPNRAKQWMQVAAGSRAGITLFRWLRLSLFALVGFTLVGCPPVIQDLPIECADFSVGAAPEALAPGKCVDINERIDLACPKSYWANTESPARSFTISDSIPPLNGIYTKEAVAAPATTGRQLLCACPDAATRTDASIGYQVITYLIKDEGRFRAVGENNILTTVTGTPVVADLDLEITLTANPQDTVPASTPLTYTLTVTNKGTTAAENVVINDRSPTQPSGAPLPITEALATSGSCTIYSNFNGVRCDLGTIAPAGQATVTIVVLPGEATTVLVNAATVTATGRDGVCPMSDKDTTNNSATVTTEVTESSYGVNLLINPDFSSAVQNGGLPIAPDNWRGDKSSSVVGEQNVVPRSNPRMLKFEATGTAASTNTVASQQWQIVDVSALRTEIDAGRIRADASVWFNRVVGDNTTDTRFDLRLIAFAGPTSELPTRFAANNWLQIQSVVVNTTGNQWQNAATGFVLPPTTNYVLFEIYAFENVLNDGVGFPEFAGHYADDASLMLTLLP